MKGEGGSVDHHQIYIVMPTKDLKLLSPASHGECTEATATGTLLHVGDHGFVHRNAQDL